MELDSENIKKIYQTKYNSSDEYKSFLRKLIDAKNSQSLFIVVGAGVSISQLYPDWNLYVESLIKYWQFNLEELLDHKEETNIKELRLEDVYFLRDLSESNLSNKRKVDLVHHIIMKYCQSDDSDVTNTLFKRNVLSFEKKYFSKYKPMISSNSILRSLVKLYPIFITTNYDQEIEKSLKLEIRVQPQVIRNISYVSKDIARPEFVIHIHGTPIDDGDIDLFISSSKSYSKLYYGRDEYHIKFREIFEERTNAVVLFVGCSMEEDEVLSLFNFNSSDIKYYSLMKYNSKNPDDVLEKYYNSTIKEYYLSKNIEFIWFGDSFGDLPIFLEKAIKDIELIDETEKAWNLTSYKLREVLLGIGEN